MIAYCDFKYVFTFTILERSVQPLWNHTVHIFPFQKAAASGLGAWGRPGPHNWRLVSGSLITGAAPSTGHAFPVLHAARGSIWAIFLPSSFPLAYVGPASWESLPFPFRTTSHDPPMSCAFYSPMASIPRRNATDTETDRIHLKRRHGALPSRTAEVSYLSSLLSLGLKEKAMDFIAVINSWPLIPISLGPSLAWSHMLLFPQKPRKHESLLRNSAIEGCVCRRSTRWRVWSLGQL